MLEGRASELKQQGAFAAARDPNSSVTAEQAEHTAVAEAKKAGAAAFVFNPDASPAEKAAQAAATAPGAVRHVRKHQTAALVTDLDDGTTAGYDLPTPTKDGAVPLSALSSPRDGQMNGHVSHAHQDEYANVGWAPRFGNPADKQEEGNMLDNETYLEGNLEDKFFGDWYQNTGVIIFACLTSWVVAVLGGGLGWIFLVMAICGTYYRTSIRRVRRNFRDDIKREMAKAKLETDHETLEWINTFLVKFWPIYAPVLCKTIVSSVDQVLSTSTPAFLDSMRLKSFTLGTKPPRLEHVKTYPKADDDTVLMDWRFSFTPNDVADLTARQIKNKVNPKIVLEVRVGKAMISTGLDVIVEDMACSGIMRVKVKLQLEFPHVEKIEICFLEKPVIDYVCKPIGGDMLGFDMNFVPGLQGFILEQVHANLGPMMYSPNVFPIEIAKMLAGNSVDQAIGVLQITFHGAQGLKNPDKFSGTPDPYATVSINNREALGKTKTVLQNANPRWNETVNVILTSLKEPLTLQVYDYNEYRKDKELGTCTFPLEQLEHETDHENQQLEVIANGRPRGLVQCDIRFFPVMEGAKLPDGTQGPPPESATGIVKFTVEQAKDLDGTKSLIGQLNPYAVLLLNGKEVQNSKKLKRTNNPIWPDATKEMLITDRKKAKLGVVLKDDRDIAADPVIGTYQIKLDDMLELMAKGQEWYNLAGVKTGRAKMMLQWKPIALKGASAGSSGYVTPIGVMRFHFQSAKDLRNLETMGKSDPYVRVMLSGVQKGRTVTFKNNLNPDWDEVIYVPVHSDRERLVLEVMDEESLGKDRSLGSVEITTSEYLKQGESGEYEVHDSKRNQSQPLRAGHGATKGSLNYTASFFPTLNVVDPEDEEEEQAEKAKDPADIAHQSIEDVPGLDRSATSGTIISMKTASTSASHKEEKDMQRALTANESEQGEVAEVQKAEVPKIKIGPEDLKNYVSGLLVFKIIEGEMAHAGYHLEVLIDDALFPAYTSAKARSRNFSFNETGDVMVRELDLSQITLRLVETVDRTGEDHESNTKAKLTGATLDTLSHSLYTPHQVMLKEKQGLVNKITVSLKFLPVKMQLDPSESFNNSGKLRVEVLDAADLPAADRNGYSDPYCKFNLNGKEVYKTKVQKKTLHPAWNEFFEVPVRSRTAAQFKCDVYDWDFGEKADHLGAAVINLDVLEAFVAQEVTLGLDGKSGAVRLKMLFSPGFVTRSRQGSSTFSGTFSTPGKVIGAPVKGVGKGAVLVGGGVAKGASFLGRGFKRRTNTNTEPIENGGASYEVPETNGMEKGPAPGSPSSALTPTVLVGGGMSNGESALPTTPHQRQRSFGAVSQSPAAETGTATISVVSVSGFPADTKLEVHIMHNAPKGVKEVLKTKAVKTKTGDATYPDEPEKVQCAADASFRIVVRDHKTFGSDDLGEATYYVDDQGSGGAHKEVRVGTGVVVVKSTFQHADGASGRGGDGLDSPNSKFLGRRLIGRRERSVTPGQ